MKVEILTTRYDPAETEITLTVLLDDPEANGWELKGRLAGPSTPLAETVEVAYPLRAIVAEDGLLRARVVIPDPCIWSPETPFLYHGPVEVWQHGQLRASTQVQHGIKEVALRRKGLRLNGEELVLKCLQGRGVSAEELPRLRQQGINALLVTVGSTIEPLWEAAARWGFFILAQLDPHDEQLLWHAQEELLDETALLGWVLPQTLIAQPQHWHNAMTLLHGQRKDVYVGLKIDEVPLGVLPGHVDFLIADADLLTEVSAEKTAKLVWLKRGQTQPESVPSHSIGWVLRSLPIP